MNISPSGINRLKVDSLELENDIDPNKGAGRVGFNVLRGPTISTGPYSVSDNLLGRAVVFDRYFGADITGDAPADNAWEALVDFVDQQKEGARILLPGRYNTRENHVFRKSNVTLDFTGGLLDGSESSMLDMWALIEFAGLGVIGESTATSNIPKGSMTINVVDSSIYSLGDYIAICSSGEYWNGIDGQSGYAPNWKGEHARVMGISPGVLTLGGPTHDSYDATTYTVFIRRIDMIENIRVNNIHAIGVGNGNILNSTVPTGVEGIRLTCVDGFVLDGAHVSDFSGTFGTSTMGIAHKLMGANLHGRNLKNPTNYPTKSSGFTGWRNRGTDDFQVIGCSMYDGRRMCDAGTSDYGWFDDTSTEGRQQAVVPRGFSITGGRSVRCLQGPSGHQYENMSVIGHDVVQCNGGIQHRGKGLYVSRTQILDCGSGITCGGSNLGPGSYPEDPSCGDVYISESVVIRSTGLGIQVRQSAESFYSAARVDSVDNAYYFFGTRQKNIHIIPRITKPEGTTGISVWMRYGVIDRKDILIEGGYCRGGTQGISIAGSNFAPVENVIVRDVNFSGLVTQLISFADGGFTWGPGIKVIGCTEYGSATTKINTGTSTITVIERNNDWS